MRARTTRRVASSCGSPAAHIDVLAARLGALGVRRLALAGGLSSSIGPWLSPETKRHLVPAAADALAGALWLARAEARSAALDELMRKVIVSMVEGAQKRRRSDDGARDSRSSRGGQPASSKAWREPLAELVGRLKRRPPQVVVTCARGSSAHAATFGKHLIERYLGIPVAEAAPNIASVYGRRLRLENQLFLAISQSGRSDDLVALASSAKAAGALTVAIVNATDGPLVPACDIVLPIGAGPELSVAATKTFVATLAALLRLTASWTDDADLGGADRAAAGSAGCRG